MPGGRSRYELLGIAPLLRKLLLDGTSLVDTVRARRSDVTIEFRASGGWPPPPKTANCSRFSCGSVDFDHAQFSGGTVNFRDAQFSSGEVDLSETI